MPWPIATNFAGLMQATIKGRLHGQETNNVLWFVHPGELANPDWPAILLQLAQDILECAVTQLLPGLTSDFRLVSVVAKRMDVADKIEAVAQPPANTVGALGEGLPSTNAGVISLKTPYVGKSTRGRIYVAGLAEGTHAQSIHSGATNAALVAFALCLAGKFKYDTGTSDEQWVIFSRKRGYTPPSTYALNDNTVSPVTTTQVREVVGTMRSRRVGSGS